MVVFHSYVSLPEGTEDSWKIDNFLNQSRGLVLCVRMCVYVQYIYMYLAYPPV
jgi:hypothetical protein